MTYELLASKCLKIISDYTSEKKDEDKLSLCQAINVSFNQKAIIQFLKSNRTSKSAGNCRIIVNLLKKITFFKDQKELTNEDYHTLCYNLKYEHFNIGEEVFSYNTEGNKFYIILHGIVAILVPSFDDPNKPVLNEVGTLQTGGYFGELSLITNKKRQ